MMFGLRGAMFEAKKSTGPIVEIPSLEVYSRGFLDHVLTSPISPPYTLNLWVKQGRNQSTSLTSSPLFFSCGGATTGSAFGNSGQTSEWIKFFGALNQPRYWVQFRGFVVQSDFDWHFLTCVVTDSYMPFTLFVDGVKTSASYSRGTGIVGTTTKGSHFGFFARTANGIDVAYNSQWIGSIARMAFFGKALSDDEAFSAYENRYALPTNADHAWEGVISGGTVKDTVGNMDLSVVGDVVQGEYITVKTV